MIVYVVLSLLAISDVCGVDRSNFKTCDQSSFCKRQRATPSGDSKYKAKLDSLVTSKHGFICNLEDTASGVLLKLEVDGISDSTIRMKVNEINGLHPRYEVPAGDVLPHNMPYATVKVDQSTAGSAVLTFADSKVVLTAEPFRMDLVQNDSPVISVNARGLFNFEHHRPNPEKAAEPPQEKEDAQHEEGKEVEPAAEETEQKEQPPAVEAGTWAEEFKSHRDSKPRGPESVGVDIAFPSFEFVYGIPEHADSLALKSTTSTDPYRLYNLDVFEYELNNPMALYGSVPVMLAHSAKSTVGMFWNNPSETWIDIKNSAADKNMLSKLVTFVSGSDSIPQVDTHWFSESGIIDVFFFLGPTPTDVFRQYAQMTGTTPLPPMFSIAYHQCRWNYNDEADVKKVDAGYDKHDIPVDSIWLDIEHTNGKRYFTWDKSRFPTSDHMIERLAAKGRKMVNTIDPHLKKVDDYKVYTEAKDVDGFLVRNKDGGAFDGWCWPGSSVWLDFLNPKVRQFWSRQFLPEVFEGSTNNLYTWNDMNEPSVFNGPEITMHKDNLHYGDVEHRSVHNIYGLYVHRSSFEGHLLREKNTRPFVLSRAYYAGSQKYGAIWTGDNMGEWSHLKMSIPMLLSNSLVGITFVGADVGGFFKNPDPELLTRWYQAGAYQPFFRAHAHLDTRRREPWLLPQENLQAVREAIIARYRLLPYWYQLFYTAEKEGGPVMKPLWVDFPDDPKTFRMDDQHLVGSALLVKPVTDAGITTQQVYLPGPDQLWYDVDTYQVYTGAQTVYIPVTLTKIPVFQRGGFIVPRKERIRRSSILTLHDPYTLVVTLDKQGAAKGKVYMDDQHSFNYRNDDFVFCDLHYHGGKLWNKRIAGNYNSDTWLERVIVVGMTSQPHEVRVTGTTAERKVIAEPQLFTYSAEKQFLTIRKPGLLMKENFVIDIR